MRLVTFASGSTGNSALVTEEETGILLDAGISLRRIRQASERCGRDLRSLAGVLITHEHDDHIRALPMLFKYTELPVYAPRTAAFHLRQRFPQAEDRVRSLDPGETLSLGEIAVTVFSTPHDTEESVGYRFAGPGGTIGFCTDTGCVTEEMLTALWGCDAALIEANHDLTMLRNGRYPYPLKRRILSDRGHLSNTDSAALACSLAGSGVRRIALGHLSRENNTPRLAYAAVREALDGSGYNHVALDVAPEDGDLIIEV